MKATLSESLDKIRGIDVIQGGRFVFVIYRGDQFVYRTNEISVLTEET